MYSIIVAMDQNRVIGYKNQLPWRLPKDLEYVRKTTWGHPIVMGRKNFESIGKPLPGRKNIVLTRNRDYRAEGCHVVHSVEDVFRLCDSEEEVFIFGGAEIYRLFFPYVNRLYITKIFHAFEGDTFFPEYREEEWIEVFRQKGVKDKENPYDYVFMIYERII